jgi:hypothetical protein
VGLCLVSNFEIGPFGFETIHNCYHDDIKKIDWKVTRKAHEEAETAIKGECLLPYHLVVLKPGNVLDNSIFSNNNINMKRYQLSTV